MNLQQFVQKITAINRAWKVALDDDNPYISEVLARRLQDQKSAWQVEFYRSFPSLVWFKADLENYPDGSVYSVRFGDTVVVSTDLDVKSNAEHIPKHLLMELLTDFEFINATKAH
ncbi:hypothetical protein [Vibrio maritimus]|uniref:hypothetical protein n=1 Tax=Vibrio maritimus TaxID=990268 RepID=UPI0037366EA8